MSQRLTVAQIYSGQAIQPGKVTHRNGHEKNTASFETILKNQTLRFSHHAEERLRQRGIQFKPEHLDKINSAIDKATVKGAKDSLLLINNTALIVNIKNRTVVTALDGASMKDNVFTQIDSAMIIS